MSYAEKNLAPGETILFRARYHWLIYRSALLLLLLAAVLGAAALYASRAVPDSGVARPASLVAVAVLLVAAVAFAIQRIRATADEFVVTNRRVIRRVGLVAREIQQAPLDKIQDITVEQSWLGRLLDCGTVILETASEHGSLVFPAIAHPESFRNRLWGQNPGSTASAAAAPASSPTAAERLSELEKLRRQGLLSEVEYSAKRKDILGSL